MKRVAFLGLGAMGLRMAGHLLASGHHITVWNRTAGKAAPLVEAGAIWAPTPAEAAKGAEIVIAMVRDDQASDHVWCGADGALAAMAADALAVESSTLSIQWVGQLGARFKAAGKRLIDAPVSGSLPQADAKQLVFLAGGASTDIEAATPTLLQMGSTVNNCGPLGTGTTMKLLVNGMLGIQVAALAELLAMAEKHGIVKAQALDVFGSTIVASTASKLAGQLMVAQDYAPRFPIELIAKDFGYALEAAGGTANAPQTAAAHELFQRAEKMGWGNEHMNAVAKLFG